MFNCRSYNDHAPFNKKQTKNKNKKKRPLQSKIPKPPVAMRNEKAPYALMRLNISSWFYRGNSFQKDQLQSNSFHLLPTQGPKRPSISFHLCVFYLTLKGNSFQQKGNNTTKGSQQNDKRPLCCLFFPTKRPQGAGRSGTRPAPFARSRLQRPLRSPQPQGQTSRGEALPAPTAGLRTRRARFVASQRFTSAGVPKRCFFVGPAVVFVPLAHLVVLSSSDAPHLVLVAPPCLTSWFQRKINKIRP